MSDETTRRAKHRAKLLFLMFAGGVSILLLSLGGYQLLQFSDSATFCGLLCHTPMHPEYTVYTASPHSRVNCASCHVGSGAAYLVRTKLTGIPLIFRTILGNYDRPIPTPVENLRPARETCAQCHRPERFSGDLVVNHTTVVPDQANTRRTDTRILRVGGGPPGTAQGIHWHIMAAVDYLALDRERQDIAWVEVRGLDGTSTTYQNPDEASQSTPARIKSEKRTMDCIDCHNRATHVFNSPDTLLDTAFVQGQLDPGLPYLKQQGLLALDPPAPSLTEAYARVEAIRDFYRTKYPQVYQQKGDCISGAIQTTRGIADLTDFPEMHMTWSVYTSDAGHQGTPGCFRCHGNLVAQGGPQQGRLISSACDLCHYFNLNQ